EALELRWRRNRVVGLHLHAFAFLRCGLDTVRIRGASAFAKRIEATRELFASCERQHCIDTIGRKFSCGFENVGALSIDRFICAELSNESDSVFPRRCGENARATLFRELQREH